MKMDSSQKYSIAITILLLMGGALYFNKEAVRDLIASEPASFAITGTWVSEPTPYIVATKGHHIGLAVDDYDGPPAYTERVGIWRFEIVERDDHLIVGTGYYDMVNADGTFPHTTTGRVSGVSLDAHILTGLQTIVLVVESVPHMHMGEMIFPASSSRYVFRPQADGRLVGYGQSYAGSLFSGIIALKRVEETKD